MVSYEEEYQICLNSFYNKYVREKGKRVYTYIEDERCSSIKI